MGSILKKAPLGKGDHETQSSAGKTRAQYHLCILEGQAWVHEAAHIVSAALGSEEMAL